MTTDTVIIKSHTGHGFVTIIPVMGCGHCPFNEHQSRWCGHFDAVGQESLGEHQYSLDSYPDWCPALAEAQEELPGTADWDFLRNDALLAKEL